ncbi:MAG: phosphate-starvation-inducible PsiE family protein [Actinomycetota bacterium]
MADRFKDAEHLLYLAVGSALAVAGFVLFGEVVYQVIDDAATGRQALERSLLDAVNGLLLVFIFAELLHTVRVLVAHDELKIEPFLVVGIVAAIRRFIVVSAEAPEVAGDDLFVPLMVELGVLMGAVLVLGGTIWLLRRSRGAAAGPTPQPVTGRRQRPADGQRPRSRGRGGRAVPARREREAATSREA